MVKGVGVGSKDWTVIRDLAADVPFDWTMFACAPTILRHPPELLAFINDLATKGVTVIDSAVFNGGFLTGGDLLNYRPADPISDSRLFAVRNAYVKLEIKYIGYCGSDLNTYRGFNPLVKLPRIPGHEISAVIVEKGASVPDAWRVGQAVTVSPYTNCGLCSSCLKGRPHCCRFNETLGVQRDGALTKYITVPWTKLYDAEGVALEELSGGHGPNCLIEAVGLPATFRAAVDEVAFAGSVTYIGYAKAPVEYQTKLFVQKELDIRGSRNATPANFRRVIEFARRGLFPIAKMLTKTYDFADAGRALADWDAAPGKVCRLAVKL